MTAWRRWRRWKRGRRSAQCLAVPLELPSIEQLTSVQNLSRCCPRRWRPGRLERAHLERALQALGTDSSSCAGTGGEGEGGERPPGGAAGCGGLQEERANLERALAWAPARILRADLEKNANLLEVLGPRELEQARLPRCAPALSACFIALKSAVCADEVWTCLCIP